MLHAGRIFEALKLFIITIKWDLFYYEVKFYLINQKKGIRLIYRSTQYSYNLNYVLCLATDHYYSAPFVFVQCL